jgi:hypothetical protein
MATTYKVLGQSNPAATTDTTLYTVPASTETVVSTITVANLGTTGTFRVAVRPAGASIANQHYVVYDATLNANDSITLTLGVTLGATDVITVRGSNTSFAFQAFGSEIA